MGKSFKWVIFHNYVSLLEGKSIFVRSLNPIWFAQMPFFRF